MRDFFARVVARLAAELRTIGLCDATDSELSIRHLAAISAADTEHKQHPLLFLSPYQMPLLKAVQRSRKSDRRARKNSSTDSLSSRSNSGKSSDEPTGTDGRPPIIKRDILRGDSTDDEPANGDRINNNTYTTRYRRLSRQRQDSNASSSSNTRYRLANEVVHTPNTIVSVTEGDDGLVRITFRKQLPKKYHSAINRIRNDSVMRSKSFQEQGVKPQMRNSRFFVSRHNNNPQQRLCSDFSLDTVSQNIEITVQNEDGVVKFAEDSEEDFGTYRGCEQADMTSQAFDSGSQEHLKSGHILSRIYRRLRKITLSGWRRQKCKRSRRQR